jgi:hypothetical protein
MPDPTPVAITATVGSTRFVTREHMLAAAEMQISGEPLAQIMGRELTSYSRDRLPTDLYFDQNLALAWTDLPGFSSAIESYEYSKQPMNMLAFESGAGTALAAGPLVTQLPATILSYAAASNSLGRFVFPAQPLGWPGLWPTLHVFASFDPAIDPTGDVALGCAITSDDDPDGLQGDAVTSGDYECDATTLHLRDRAAQIDPTITPGADGFSGWKYALWTMNYLQIMHDANEAPVTTVDPGALAAVGSGGPVYLGSSDLEGFLAQLFVAMLDNRAADWLGQLSTDDGVTLSGFASIADALAYDEVGALRWFPGAIGVTEAVDGTPSYTLASADSDALDLIGVALGYASIYALTDTTNVDVGGAQPARAVFDGDPFAADDQLADGEATLHDRALAMIRVALVDLDRLHTDPVSGFLVDHVAMTGTAAAPGHTLSTTTAAYAIIGLRTTLRALGGQLELYSNETTDTAIGATVFDAWPLHAASGEPVAFTARVGQLLEANARLLYDHVTDASGRAWSGWDVAAGAPTDDGDMLDAHTAAIRGLFAAYLATGDTRYRDRAIAVFDRMDATFYDADARIYAATPAPATDVEYTPLRFALLQSALRDMYELVATRPGGATRVPVIEARLARLNKLVLNGWDDRDGDQLVAWPDECANVVGGLPRGGLQMAERTLTGELGSLQAPLLAGDTRVPTSDREHDCVPEIDDAQLPAALADSVTFHVARE